MTTAQWIIIGYVEAQIETLEAVIDSGELSLNRHLVISRELDALYQALGKLYQGSAEKGQTPAYSYLFDLLGTW